jgi:hypothetical protein
LLYRLSTITMTFVKEIKPSTAYISTSWYSNQNFELNVATVKTFELHVATEKSGDFLHTLRV